MKEYIINKSSLRSCWTSYQSGGDYGMWTINYTLNGATDLPELPIPDYIIRTFNCCGICSACNSTPYGFPYQHTLLSAHANARWGNNCNAPEPATPWQRIAPSPYSLDVGMTGGDLRPPSTPSSYFTMSMGHAIAVRFTPVSRFLPYLVLHDVVNLVSGKKTIIEIRSNGPGNLPLGSPGDNNILARSIITLPIQQFVDAGGNWTTTVYNYNSAIPINAILAGTEFVPDTPYWIVIYSEDFVCSDAYIGGIYERVKFAKSNTQRNDVAIWSQTSGCNSWAIDPTIDSISFATYKTDSGTPQINISDYGFAELTPTPTYVNTNCFGSRIAMEGKNVAVGINFEVPRHYQKIKFNIAYQKPDGRFKTFSSEILDVTLGTHTIFIDSGEKYMPGVYKDIAVTAVVLII